MKPVAPRANNRNEELLDAAAELFATQGFRGTTMRHIAGAAGMLPGSIYYHYGSKDDLLLAVYEAGVAQVIDEFNAGVASATDPWEQLGHAISSHISSVTRKSPYMRVINRVMPEDVPKYTDALIALRGRYEDCLRNLIDELPLALGVSRSLLRLMVLGAINHTQIWFDPDGTRTPDEIGKAFTRFLTDPLAPSHSTEQEGGV